MTIPINMTLYRLLVKTGATEAEAQEAATWDASGLVTKADLADLRADFAELRIATKADLALTKADLLTALAELKAGLFKHTTQTLIWVTAVFGIVMSIIVGLSKAF